MMRNRGDCGNSLRSILELQAGWSSDLAAAEVGRRAEWTSELALDGRVGWISELAEDEVGRGALRKPEVLEARGGLVNVSLGSA
jgi:hypothetical protein